MRRSSLPIVAPLVLGVLVDARTPYAGGADDARRPSFEVPPDTRHVEDAALLRRNDP